MKTNELVLAALLLALGLVLHTVTPPILAGVKPDFLLATMFIAILSQPKVQNTVLIGLVAGILAAMTTGFPGGQIPNIIDKFITAFFVLGLIHILKNKLSTFTLFIIGFIATLVSGTIFLTSALILVGLPAPLSALFIAVVLPAAVANSITSALFYKIFTRVSKPVLSRT